MVDEQIKKHKEEQKLVEENIRKFEKRFAEAQSDFQEYDAKYQAIEAERIRIKNKINAFPKKDEATLGGNVHEGCIECS